MNEPTNAGNRPEDILDEEHPQWCVNEQIKDLLLGFGANEDSRMVIAFFQDAGLPFGTAERIHHAIVGAERIPTNVKAHAPAAPNSESNLSADSGLHDAACSLSSLSPNGWIVFPSEDAYQIACNNARKAGDSDLLEDILNKSLLDWPAFRHRLEKREPRPIFRVDVVRQKEDESFKTLLVGEDLRVLFDDLSKLLLSGVVGHCSVSVESVKIENHV
jgi:hypothetical protein